MRPSIGGFGRFYAAAFEVFDIGEDEFGFHRSVVAGRIDLRRHMRNIIILKTADNVQNSVCFTHMRQKLISHSFSKRSANAVSRSSGTGTTPTFGSIVQNG